MIQSQQYQDAIDSNDKKIYEMIKEVNKLGLKSINTESKDLEKIKSFQQKKDAYIQQQLRESKQLAKNYNEIEKQIMQNDKAGVISRKIVENDQQEINHKVQSFEEHIKKKMNKQEQITNRYNSKILKHKLLIAEAQQLCKTNAYNFAYESESKIGSLNHRIDELDTSPLRKLEIETKQNFRDLRKQIQTDFSANYREQTKMEKSLLQMKLSLKHSLNQQMKKQKQSFDNNYEALEKIFSLLFEQIM